MPVHILDNVIDKALSFAIGAADRPCTGDVTGIALELTARIHEDQLPIWDPLHKEEKRIC